MDLAYDTEELVRITIQADTVWTAPDTIRVSLDTGTTLALTISARNRVEVNRLANDGPYTLSLTRLPPRISPICEMKSYSS